MLCHVNILSLNGEFSQRFPVRFSLIVQLRWVQNHGCLFKVSGFKCKPKINQSLIQWVSRNVAAIVVRNKHFRFSIFPFNRFDLSFDIVNCHFLWVINRIPNIQVLPVLRHHNFTLRNPFTESTIRQKCVFRHCGQVVNVKLFSLVLKKQFIRVRIQLKVINLGIVVDLAHNRRSLKVEQWYRLKIQQISNYLCPLFVYLCWYQISFHVFCSACSQWIVSAILD